MKHLFVLIALLMAVPISPARAGETAGANEQQALFEIARLNKELGRKAFVLKQYDIALKYFMASQQAHPEHEMNYFIARCYEQRSFTTMDLELALQHFVEFVDSYISSENTDPAMMSDAFAKIEVIKAELARREQVVSVRTTGADVVPPPLSEPQKQIPPKRTWLWTAVGTSITGVALGIVGAGLMAYGWDQRNTAVANNDPQLISSAKTNFNTGVGLLGAGGVVLSFDVYAIYRAAQEARGH